MKLSRLEYFCAAWVAVLIGAALPVYAQQSPRFVMNRASLSVVNGAAGSARFATVAVATQSAVSGSASHCNQGFVAGLGFWSVTGATPVPIVLHVDTQPTDTETLQLHWSGADPEFRLFRSTAPDDVTDPANLVLQTPNCLHTRIESDDTGLVFYKVLQAP